MENLMPILVKTILKVSFSSPRIGVVGHSHRAVGHLLSVRQSVPVTSGYGPSVVPSLGSGGRGV